MMRGTFLTIYLLTVLLLISMGVLGTVAWNQHQSLNRLTGITEELESCEANVTAGQGAYRACEASQEQERAECAAQLEASAETAASCQLEFSNAQESLRLCEGQLRHERASNDAYAGALSGLGGGLEEPHAAPQSQTVPQKTAAKPAFSAAGLLIAIMALGTFTAASGGGVLLARQILKE